jgi:mannose-6-phosphate isomerase
MLPPLRFAPLFKNYLWGGRRLETLLGKSLGEGPHWAESWELVDHGDDQSVVVGGPLAGCTLGQIVASHNHQLLGRHAGLAQFPLLFKYLDAQRTLSVQVHPNDQQGARLDPPDLGKTEAWVVLASEPGSKIYAGLRPGVDRQTLAAAIRQGHCDECLHAFEPAVGDCVFIEAGTVHALGAGIVIAEIQQASNTTFRLFDWNRTDASGQSRPLHIDQSLATIDFDRGAVAPQQPQPTDHPSRQRLVACDKFVLDRCGGEATLPVAGDDRFHILSLCGGPACQVEWPGGREQLSRGDTLLLPAGCGAARLVLPAGATLLDMYLPD